MHHRNFRIDPLRATRYRWRFIVAALSACTVVASAQASVPLDSAQLDGINAGGIEIDVGASAASNGHPAAATAQAASATSLVVHGTTLAIAGGGGGAAASVGGPAILTITVRATDPIPIFLENRIDVSTGGLSTSLGTWLGVGLRP